MGKKIKVGVTINKAWPCLRKDFQTGRIAPDNFARIQLTGEVQIDAKPDEPVSAQIEVEMREIKFTLEQEYSSYYKQLVDSNDTALAKIQALKEKG